MAQCKVCQKKGFMIETDVNGLCGDCAPYYYVAIQDDLKDLNQALTALERIDYLPAARNRLQEARDKLTTLRPYAQAGLVQLPRPAAAIERSLILLEEKWQEE